MKICTHCGFDLKAAAPVSRGRWTVEQTCVRYDGVEVRLSRQAILIMHALASVAPMIIEAEPLGARVSDSSDPVLAVRQIMVQIRHATGPHFPIENVPTIGYRWIDC